MLDLKLFKNSTVSLSMLSSAILGAFYVVGFFFMPLYLSNIRNLNDFTTGAALFVVSIFVAILSPIMGWIIDRYSAKYLIACGLLLMVIAALLQAFFSAHSSWPYVIIAFCIFGLGWGFLGSPVLSAVMQAIPKDASGAVAGSLWTIQNMGGCVALAIAIAIFQLSSGIKLASQMQVTSFMHGYNAAMWFLFAIALLTFLSVLRFMKR